MIRMASEEDLPRLPEIEVAAGQLFRDFDMPEIADDPPPPIEVYREALDARLLWVAEVDDVVVGYGLGCIVDNHLHAEQASIDPEFAGHGIGRHILLTMVEWARENRQLPCTLTTFVDVPWNAAYYRTFGFIDVPDSQLGPELTEVVRQEQATDLAKWTRICMLSTG